jgi:hypothetical protein
LRQTTGIAKIDTHLARASVTIPAPAGVIALAGQSIMLGLVMLRRETYQIADCFRGDRRNNR